MQKIDEVCGVSGLSLANPNERLPDDAVPRLWRQVQKEKPDEALTLKMARAAPFSCFAGLAEGAQFARDVREAMKLLKSNRALLADRLKVDLIESEEEALLVHSHPNDEIDSGRTSELAAAMIVRLVREILDAGDAIRRVTFHFAPWGPAEIYEEVFALPVAFNQPHSGVIFWQDKLALPVSQANAELFAYVRKHFEQTLRHIEAGAYPEQLDKLRRAIADNATIGVFDGRAAAEKAYMSLRSAQRLAAAQNTTLNQLIDQIRAEFAEELLGDPEISIAQVAQLVGYSDERAFRRAFRRWTDQTPAAFRRSQGIR